MDTMPTVLEVSLESFADLAVECWRLQRWLASSPIPAAIVGRHVVRRIDALLKEHEIEVLDVTGQPYEPGLAVEVIDSIADEGATEGGSVIDETVAPIVLWKGLVIRHGKVVTRRGASAPK